MRLLETKTCKLVEFVGINIPKYGILSHTWGGEEVTLQELRDHPKETWAAKEGGKKILGFCKLAAAIHGEDYVWVDTCCIDKSSSTELSEAINSMFRWYQDASRCYAYLKDVTSRQSSHNSIIEQISKSRWFTRGWTLQEMLAPSELIFYDTDWSLLGNKTTLWSLIREVTGIAPPFLDDYRKASVAQRMFWASRRQTTREEDMSYCLLGLFNVHMPLIYGEGSDKAFLRLQTEIINSSEDQSILAWLPMTREKAICPRLLAISPAEFGSCGNFFRSFSRSIDSFWLANSRIHLSLTDKPSSHFSYQKPYNDIKTCESSGLGEIVHEAVKVIHLDCAHWDGTRPDCVALVVGCKIGTYPQYERLGVLLDPISEKEFTEAYGKKKRQDVRISETIVLREKQRLPGGKWNPSDRYDLSEHGILEKYPGLRDCSKTTVKGVVWGFPCKFGRLVGKRK